MTTEIVHISHYTKPIFDESWWYIALRKYLYLYAETVRRLEKSIWEEQRRMFNTIVLKNGVKFEENKEYTWPKLKDIKSISSHEKVDIQESSIVLDRLMPSLRKKTLRELEWKLSSNENIGRKKETGP